MSGIVYSELANWDGGLSASGSQTGNTSREPTAAPPSPSGSPAPRLESDLPSTSARAHAPAGAAGTGSAQGTLGFDSLEDTFLAPPQPSGSGSAAGSFTMEQMRGTPSMRGDAPRAGIADRHQDASKKVLHSQSPPRQSPLFTPEPDYLIERKHIPPSMAREAQAPMPSIYHSRPAPSYTFNLAVDISFAQTSPVLTTAPRPRSISVARSPIVAAAGDPSRSAGDEGDESLLDADGDTDNDSSVSVYVISTPSQHAGSTQRSKPIASHPRGSTGTTAVSRTSASGTPPPSWEHIAKVAIGSYSDEFLEAAQQYYVSPSPSLQARESAPPEPSPAQSEQSANPHESFVEAFTDYIQLTTSPQAGGSGLATQSNLRPTSNRPPEPHSAVFLSSLSPLSSLDSSPIFSRTVPNKRRRLDRARPFVQVPSLPSDRPRELYKPARDVQALQARPAETDYAAELGAMLNQATSNNADLMNVSVSPSIPPSGRRLRQQNSLSASPTKAVTRARADHSVPVVRRGRPPGSKNKKKAPESAAKQGGKERPSVPAKQIAREEEGASDVSEESPSRSSDVHQPADAELEPYFPSTCVDIGNLPKMPAALFLVALRALLGSSSRDPPSPTTASATVPTTAAQKPGAKAVPPLPRRAQLKQIPPKPTAQLPPSEHPTSATSINPAPLPLPSQNHISHVQPSFYTSSLPPSIHQDHTDAPSSLHLTNPNDPPPPPIISPSGSMNSDQFSGLNLLADFGSSSSSHGSPSLDKPSNDAPNLPPSTAGHLDYVPHNNPMQFHQVSQYAAQGPSDVDPLFAAEHALRDVHMGIIDGADAANGMPSDNTGQSYFAHMGIDLHYAHSAPVFVAWPAERPPSPAAQHAPMNGTIDPSLLGTVRPAPEPSFRPSSPLEDRIAGPSKKRPRVKQVPPTGSPASTAITSSDESSSDDEPLSVKRARPQLPIRLPREIEDDSPSKRARRLTERAKAAYYVSSDTDEELRSSKKAKAAGKGKGRGKGKGKGKERATEYSSGEESYRALAKEPTFCHQCRNRSLIEKMRCTVIKENGVPCGLRYCERCIVNRYPDLTFHPYAVRFSCPRCRGVCNCTSCCARRGEVYISARVGKLPLPGSAEAAALMEEAANALDRSSSCAPAEAQKIALVGGQYFGVVYGLSGERVGSGFVRKDSAGIVVKAPPAARRRRKAVAYIGQPRPRKKPTAPVGQPAGEHAAPANLLEEPSTAAANPPSVPPSHPLPEGLPPQAPSTKPTTIPAGELTQQTGASHLPPRKTYIGNRAALDNATYLPLDALIAKWEEEELEDRAHDWAAPASDPISSTGGDEAQHSDGADAPQPPRDEVQWAIALALQAVHVDAVKT